MRQRSVATVLLPAVFAAAIAALCFFSSTPTRWLWTVIIAALPLVWMWIGFHNWRLVCPLARMQRLPHLVREPSRRISPRWIARAPLIQLGVMFFCLTLRHTNTNAGSAWIVWFLIALFSLSLVFGLFFTGKSFCHFACPIGIVERIYLSPSEGRRPDSKCQPCTGCVRNCADIDLENAHWKSRTQTAFQIAIGAWPGIVVGFYCVFWLWHHSWHTYFGGVWTVLPAPHTVVIGGITLPLAIVAPLTMACGGLLSLLLFFSLRRSLRRIDTTDSDHVALAIFAWLGFLCFYFFAGKPSLAHLPEWSQVMIATIIVATASIVLMRKLQRSENAFVRARLGQKLRRRWAHGATPDETVPLVHLPIVHAERQAASERNLAAYGDTLRELIADGVVTQAEHQVMTTLKAQLGISDRQHKRLVAQLTREEQAILEGAGRLRGTTLEAGVDSWLTLALHLHTPIRTADLHSLAEQHGTETTAIRDTANALLSADSRIAQQMRTRQQMVHALATALAIVHDNKGNSMTLDFCQHVFSETLAAEQIAFEAFTSALKQVLGFETVAPPVNDVSPLATLCESDIDLVRACALLVSSRVAPERSMLIAGTEDSASVVRNAAYLGLRNASLLSPLLTAKAAQDSDPQIVAAFAQATPADTSRTVRDRRLAEVSALERLVLLHHLPLLSNIDSQTLQDLAALLTQRSVQSGSYLCRIGDPADAVFIVATARVAIEKNGRTIVNLGRGEVIGELGALDGAPRSADVRVTEDGEVLVLSARAFRQAMTDSSAFSLSVVNSLAERLRQAMA